MPTVPHSIRPARAGHDEARQLSALALRAKAYWGYSAEFMAACRDELSYTPAQISVASAHVYVAEPTEFFLDSPTSILGFYALEELADNKMEMELAALFIEPAYIGQGLGRALLRHAQQIAQQLGAKDLLIQADPNAAGFYQAAGATLLGQRESDSIPGRYLPLYQLTVAAR